MKKLFLILFLIGLAQAQAQISAPKYANEFLAIGQGARGLAMGKSTDDGTHTYRGMVFKRRRADDSTNILLVLLSLTRGGAEGVLLTISTQLPADEFRKTLFLLTGGQLLLRWGKPLR